MTMVRFELTIHIHGEAERERLDALVKDLKTNPLLQGNIEIHVTIKDDGGQVVH